MNPLGLSSERDELSSLHTVTNVRSNINRALILADKSAYNYYSDFTEKGYYNRVIAGNINQVAQVDSVVCDFNEYPYIAKTYARQLIIRQSNVTERTLVTVCKLLARLMLCSIADLSGESVKNSS